MTVQKESKSPMMAQYAAIKANYPGCILLYRIGDFYETFGEDAKITSKVLGIVLTRKMAGGGEYTELAGVPHHALDAYLPKLVRAGYKVAVCDQLEDPKSTKKIVKRGVTELVTPGISYNDNLLDGRENNWLACCIADKERAGIAFLDISTGAFKVSEGSLDYIDVLINDFAPKEVLLKSGSKESFKERFGNSYYLSTIDEWAFVEGAGRKRIEKQFNLNTLKGFGIEELPLGIRAAGAILFYLDMTEHKEIGHIRTISRIDKEGFVWIDKFTFRNLEIFKSLSGDEGVSLLQVMDCCASVMGARKLREWLAMPLVNQARIRARHDAVQAFLERKRIMAKVREDLAEIGDLERIISRASAGRITPRETLQLSRGLQRIDKIMAAINDIPEINDIIIRLDSLLPLSTAISNTILADAAVQIGKGNVIASGVNAELDELRNIRDNSKDILLQIQQTERDRTGIVSLKISYNNVYGYYLEVRNTYSDKVPADWIRKQTLVSAERYVTPELKEYEEKILSAEERIVALESAIFSALVEQIRDKIDIIQRNADAVAELDCLANFAFIAAKYRYCRPQIDDSLVLDIKKGRHPVIENMLQATEEYVANDLYLENNSEQIMILTGPNMSGKSAFLRQAALIVYMAQIGSFVPAKSARLGYIDKIFTRVGASDNISRGESTFMVEMLETATILNNLSQRSLVLLDEIGRGTSTYDGMSIAWAIVEYLHGHHSAAKTLFATHYHELNALEGIYSRVHNFHIETKEADGNVIFLRHLKPGGVATSFGIHVAKIAGMPHDVIAMAENKLKSLEENLPKKEISPSPNNPVQLSFFQLDDPLLLEIKDILAAIDINSISPLDAFDTIRKLKTKLEGKQWISSKI